MNKKTILRIENISKTYRNNDVHVPALIDVSLTIEEGEFVMITGRNGSGKSTLLHQLGLLDMPDKGKIMLNDKEVVSMNESMRTKLRLEYLGYIFQEYALIAELTALENVMLPAMLIGNSRDARKKAVEIFRKVNLEKKINRLPSQLSGGEQQKVAIARSLINDPVIIFADEPTANLDTTASVEVLDLFKKINEEGRTIVMITHEEEELKYASRLIKLSDGKLI
jgi:putative ABC transport system ATP-binding protein